jgi:hypothetical protein
MRFLHHRRKSDPSWGAHLPTAAGKALNMLRNVVTDARSRSQIAGEGAPVSARMGRLGEHALVASLGVLLVALAYRGGRLGTQGAIVLYWAGELLIFVPIAARLLWRRPRTSLETIGLIVLLAAGLYLVKVCYSPAEFRFPDELQHWRTAQDILDSGRLFLPNFSLPISPFYPGLESVAVALVAVSGLSLFVSGLLVAGIAHLLLVCLIYLLARSISGSETVGAVTAVLYATTAHFQFFDSMFVYLAFALPFFLLAVLAAQRLSDPARTGSVIGWMVVGILSVATVAVSHHVTSAVLTLTLLSIAGVWALSTGHRRAARWPLLLGMASLGISSAWMGLVASDTLGYLGPSLDSIVAGFRGLFSGVESEAGATLTGPAVERVISMAAVALTGALIPVVAWPVWRRERGNGWLTVAAIGSLSYYGVVGVRLVSTDGPELAGRAMTYAFLPVSLLLALLLGRGVDGFSTGWGRRRLLVWAGSLTGAVLLFVAGIVGGWPPHWERLPGGYQAGAFESSIEEQGKAAARWTASHLGPANRIGADTTNLTLQSTYGGQDAVGGVAPLYYSSGFASTDISLVAETSLRYLLVDLRLSRFLPISGSYFAADPLANRHTTPIPLEALQKFDGITGIRRMYDGGSIVVYDLRGSSYAW